MLHGNIGGGHKDHTVCILFGKMHDTPPRIKINVPFKGKLITSPTSLRSATSP